jgi:3-polyprenyl-4-hydroxybenzoate decarboxylase
MLWSLTTRVDPERDVAIIPGLRGHGMDASLIEFGKPGMATWQRFGGKMIIDATRPPTSAPDERAVFERIKPLHNDEIRLEDFLAEAAVPEPGALRDAVV